MSLGNSITTILQQFLSKFGPKISFQFSYTPSPSTVLPHHQSHQSPATHTLSLSADTNRWRKLNFCTTTLALTVVQVPCNERHSPGVCSVPNSLPHGDESPATTGEVSLMTINNLHVGGFLHADERHLPSLPTEMACSAILHSG